MVTAANPRSATNQRAASNNLARVRARRRHCRPPSEPSTNKGADVSARADEEGELMGTDYGSSASNIQY